MDLTSFLSGIVVSSGVAEIAGVHIALSAAKRVKVRKRIVALVDE